MARGSVQDCNDIVSVTSTELNMFIVGYCWSCLIICGYVWLCKFNKFTIVHCTVIFAC